MAKQLLTRERADELVALPKRIVRPDEFSWRASLPPADAAEKKYRETALAPLVISFRLICSETRDRFRITGYMNDLFGYNLIYQTGDALRRIDCQAKHRFRDPKTGERVTVDGPHLHVFVEGHNLHVAEPVDWYSFDEPEEALVSFLERCNVVNPPPLQRALRFHDHD